MNDRIEGYAPPRVRFERYQKDHGAKGREIFGADRSVPVRLVAALQREGILG